MKSPQLPSEVLLEKIEQGLDLGMGALPVFPGESIERQHLEAQAGGGFHRVADSLDSRPVARDPRQAPLAGPAAVSVHDDRDVAGKTRQVEGVEETLLFRAGLGQSLQVIHVVRFLPKNDRIIAPGKIGRQREDGGRLRLRAGPQNLGNGPCATSRPSR